MAFGKAVVWEQRTPAAQGWLWSRNTDLLWVGGGAFFLFILVIAPITLWGASGPLLYTLFLHLAIVCNYPHYAATYQVILRERHTRPRAFKGLLISTPLMLALLFVGARWPDLIWGPLVRLYLTWSAHHYAAQHFGLAVMYSARFGRPLADGEKKLVQGAFLGIGVFMMLMANTEGADPATAARVVGLSENGGYVPVAGFPPWMYPVGLVLVAVSVGAYVLAERRLAARTGKGFEKMVLLLFLTNIAWFVVPNLKDLSGAPLLRGNLVLALAGAPAFFHCAQYLAVTGHRSLLSGPMKPIWAGAGLVYVGYVLFHGAVPFLPRLFAIDHLRGILLVVSVVNLHHFWMDGLMWRRPKRAPATSPAPAAVAPVSV